MSPLARCAVVVSALIAVTACDRSSPPAAPAPPPSAPVAPAPVAPAPVAVAPAPTGLPAPFAAALARAGMTFAMPTGFTPVPTVDNPQWQYDFAMRSADGTVEVRIRVDPLDEQLAAHARCKLDPGCHDTDPNARKTVWLMAIAGNIGGGGGLPQINELPVAGMRADYGADYGAVTEVVPAAVMKTPHQQALVFLIHKDDRADAVFAVLHDGLREDQLPAVLQGLRFTP